MKSFAILSMMLVCVETHAMDSADKFNSALLEGINKDVKDDVNDKFQKKPTSRAPASVESTIETDSGQEDQKFNKMNVKQIGPSKW